MTTTTTTYPRRIRKTGHPLGMLDVLEKIVETGIDRIKAGLTRKIDKPTTVAAEVVSVRRLAADHQRHAPGFATDLYAAADQHENSSPR